MYNNNDYFKARALEEIQRAKRYPSFVSLLSFDLSHINSENELENFDSLDNFLNAIKELVGKSIRETDLVSSISGGKIAILLLETPKDGAVILSNRLKKSIKYFLCNNTKSPLNWRVFSQECCFPGPKSEENSFIAALNSVN